MTTNDSTAYPLRTHSSLRGDNTARTGLYRVTSASSLNAQRCNTGVPMYGQYFQQSAYQQPFPQASQQPFFGSGFYPIQQQFAYPLQQQFGYPQPYGYQQQQQQPYYYGSYGSIGNFPVTSVNPAPVTYPPVTTVPAATKPTPAPAPAPAPVSGGSSAISNPITGSLQPKDNPLNWARFSQPKSAIYPAAPLDNPNTHMRCLVIGINNTGNDKFHLDNPIFDLMFCTEFFCYKACKIPIDNAVVMAGCLADKTFEPTAANIQTQMKALVDATNADENGSFVMWYSGHGTDAGGGHQDMVGEDLKMITDDFVLQTLGQGLKQGRSGVVILDACHLGGENFPFVASASDDVEKTNLENTQGVDLSNNGHVKLFLTSAADQTSADGLVGQGGAGSQALRYALVKHGMGITNQQVLDTTSSWLKAHGFTQTPSIQSSHPFKMEDRFFPESMIPQMGQLERSIHGSRDLQEHEDVRPSWQKPYILQAKIADQYRRLGHLDAKKAKAELELANLLNSQMKI